jgi:hypothetical protein
MSIDVELLKKHIREWRTKLADDPVRAQHDKQERDARVAYYQAQSADRILAMSQEEFYEYISKLWAMRVWGNKSYVVNKLVKEHGFDSLKSNLADLVWGDLPIEQRWNAFRSHVKGMGPAMMSEILCHSHPEQYVLWNRRAYVGFRYLGIDDLPRFSYQVTGPRYKELCEMAKQITAALQDEGIPDANLLTLDFFIWDELQFEENLSQIHKKSGSTSYEEEKESDFEAAPEFLHDDVRDKLEQIGTWLGFTSKSEIKVAEGAKVDTVWEASIGNLGRVIYVFEVQTKGSIDSLIINLLKSLNNPAVQGIVAVSDLVQIEKIKKEVAGVGPLREKLKYWDYKEVLKVHEALESVNESINSLGLLPESLLSL